MVGREKRNIKFLFLQSKCKQKGFTLIELMIASALLMMIMFSGYYAYSLYSQKWQKRVEFFWKGTEQAIALDSLNKMLMSTMPYIVNCKNDKACVFFEGGKKRLKFVTHSAIFSNEPALVQLTVEPYGDRYSLVYQEQNFSNNLVLEVSEKLHWQHKIILLKNLTELNFSYFGWPSFIQASEQANNVEKSRREDTRVWYSNHQTETSRILPEKIQLNFTRDSEETNFKIALPQHSFYTLIAYLQVDA